MTPEENLQKAIQGLECCLPMTTRDGWGNCMNCPYNRKITLESGVCDCCHDLMADALALLKAHEPRVLMPEEVRNDGIIVWYEVKGEGPCPCIVGKYDPNSLFFMGTIGHGITTISEWDEYGKTWRCWTALPTDEQRRAVKWE